MDCLLLKFYYYMSKNNHFLSNYFVLRHHSLRLFVTLTTVTCIKYPERARMLNQWIQVAMELKTTLGNLFGFSAVMSGLRSPQVSTHLGIFINWK